jgi:aarF domain-containing kinase
LGLLRAFKGISLYRKLHAYIDLLVDVHGHQIFLDGCFNGDPHPGNILELSDGRLGLIDYGQTRVLEDQERLSIAQVVYYLGTGASIEKVADSMRRAGFKTKLDGDEILAEYAALFFDSDHVCREKGFATPQDYFQTLMETDPLEDIPDAASTLSCSCLFAHVCTILFSFLLQITYPLTEYVVRR